MAVFKVEFWDKTSHEIEFEEKEFNIVKRVANSIGLGEVGRRGERGLSDW